MWPGLIIGAVAFIIFFYLVKKRNPKKPIQKSSTNNSEKSDEYQFTFEQDDAEDLKAKGMLLRCDVHDDNDEISGWRTFRILGTDEDFFTAESPFLKKTEDEPPLKINYDWIFEWKAIAEEKPDSKIPSAIQGKQFTDKDAENAIKFKKTVLIKYESASGEITDRKVDIEKSENGVFKAWCHLRGVRKNFRIDRVLEWRML